MKILVATSDVPFVEGGHRVIAKALVRALREAGHTAELLPTPQNRFGRQFAAYLATRLTDVELSGSGERIDRLISIRFPAYLLKHPNHICWLNHRMREYYDLWPEWTARLGWKGKIKESIRRALIQRADRYFLTHNVRKLFAQSKNIQAGLARWGSIPSEVLYPPAPLRNYRTESYGDFIFSPARLTPLKRVPLLIEALAACTKNARAVIAGDGEERDRIESLIRSHSLQDRVMLLGHAGEEKVLELYSKCRAVYYAPKNEDFGLVSVEAFQSRKPVITATDSGGPTELIRHEINGFVLDPSVQAISRAINLLYDDPTLAERLGSAGFESVQSITWPETIHRLLTA